MKKEILFKEKGNKKYLPRKRAKRNTFQGKGQEEILAEEKGVPEVFHVETFNNLPDSSKKSQIFIFTQSFY